jgi:hypothetical protein
MMYTTLPHVRKQKQTPDDVYYSPARPKAETVRSEDKEEKYTQEENNYAYNDDRYIRMKVRNRNRWSDLDDYYSDPYAYTYKGCYCSCNYNPRLYWSSNYTPYAPKVVYTSKSPIYSKPRTSNLRVFDGQGHVDTKKPAEHPKVYTTKPVNRTTPTDNAGNVLRSIFRGSDNSSSSNTNTKSTNSSTPSSSNSSGSSSTNNGNAPTRKF